MLIQAYQFKPAWEILNVIQLHLCALRECVTMETRLLKPFDPWAFGKLSGSLEIPSRLVPKLGAFY